MLFPAVVMRVDAKQHRGAGPDKITSFTKHRKLQVCQQGGKSLAVWVSTQSPHAHRLSLSTELHGNNGLAQLFGVCMQPLIKKTKKTNNRFVMALYVSCPLKATPDCRIFNSRGLIGVRTRSRGHFGRSCHCHPSIPDETPWSAVTTVKSDQ